MINGEYYKTFGVMILDEFYNEKNNITKEMDSAFLHESIHFIQDFGTVYGINMAVHKLSKYLETIKQIVNDGKFKKYLDLSNEEEFVNSYFECIHGDSFNIKGNPDICHVINGIKLDDVYKEYFENDFPDKEYIFKPSIVIEYNDGKEYMFGGEAIAESMAYLFEQCIYNANDYHENAIPYNICKVLYEFVLGEKCKNLPVLIAICYVSLLNNWPGYTFYKVLNIIKEAKFIPEHMNQVFHLAQSELQTISNEQMNNLFARIDLALPIDEEDEIMHNELMKEFVDNLKYCNIWLKKQYKYLISHETKFRDALIYVLESIEKNKRLPALHALLDQYGHPIIIDKAGKLYSANDEKLVFLLAPYALEKLILHKDKKCSLYEVCRAYSKKTASECFNCCWKVKFLDNICIFRFYLYIMNLGGVQFEKLIDSPF